MASSINLIWFENCRASLPVIFEGLASSDIVRMASSFMFMKGLREIETSAGISSTDLPDSRIASNSFNIGVLMHEH